MQFNTESGTRTPVGQVSDPTVSQGAPAPLLRSPTERRQSLPPCVTLPRSENNTPERGLLLRTSELVVAWSRELSRVIVANTGERLTTLQHAADYIYKLPTPIEQRANWQKAIKLLIEAAENSGDVEAATEQVTLAMLLDGYLDLKQLAK